MSVYILPQATGPFLHIGALAAVTALAWLVAGQVARAEKTSEPASTLIFTIGYESDVNY